MAENIAKLLNIFFKLPQKKDLKIIECGNHFHKGCVCVVLEFVTNEKMLDQLDYLFTKSVLKRYIPRNVIKKSEAIKYIGDIFMNELKIATKEWIKINAKNVLLISLGKDDSLHDVILDYQQNIYGQLKDFIFGKHKNKAQRKIQILQNNNIDKLVMSCVKEHVAYYLVIFFHILYLERVIRRIECEKTDFFNYDEILVSYKKLEKFLEKYNSMLFIRICLYKDAV